MTYAGPAWEAAVTRSTSLVLEVSSRLEAMAPQWDPQATSLHTIISSIANSLSVMDARSDNLLGQLQTAHSPLE